MIKQFLLNPDGSIPNNINIEVLQQEGIKIVMPTPVPRESGMVAIEQEPILINGTWHQSWKLEELIEENEIIELE
jgi:hypothetical protein